MYKKEDKRLQVSVFCLRSGTAFTVKEMCMSNLLLYQREATQSVRVTLVILQLLYKICVWEFAVNSKSLKLALNITSEAKARQYTADKVI